MNRFNSFIKDLEEHPNSPDIVQKTDELILDKQPIDDLTLLIPILQEKLDRTHFICYHKRDPSNNSQYVRIIRYINDVRKFTKYTFPLLAVTQQESQETAKHKLRTALAYWINFRSPHGFLRQFTEKDSECIISIVITAYPSLAGSVRFSFVF